MLHNFGGANGIFGPLERVNQVQLELMEKKLKLNLYQLFLQKSSFLFLKGPTQGRLYPNSSMVGVGITMEGINQNELMYEFFVEKSWRANLSEIEVEDW